MRQRGDVDWMLVDPEQDVAALRAEGDSDVHAFKSRAGAMLFDTLPVQVGEVLAALATLVDGANRRA